MSPRPALTVRARPGVRSRRAVALAAGALLLLTAACGSDDESSGSDESTTEATDETGSEDAAGEDGTDEDGTGSDGEAAVGDCVEIDLSEVGDLGLDVTLPAGPAPTELVSEDVVEGDGDVAEVDDEVTVNYHGISCSTGEVFDSSFERGEPATFPLSEGQLIQGWVDGVPGMAEGGVRILTIPSDLAYGDSGNGGIAGGETLVFVIEMVDVA